MTQQELNHDLAGRAFEEQGVVVSDIRVVLTDREVICSLQGRHRESGLHAGLAIRGVPRAVDGAAYFKVNDIALDRSLSGFKRLIVKAAIDKAIEQNATPDGVPIPIDGVAILDIELTDGAIRVTGRTR